MRRHLSIETEFDLLHVCDHTVEQRDIEKFIAKQLSCLKPHEKEALEAYTGISVESCRSLSRRRNVSVQTVCNWAHQAIAKLRPALEGCL